MTPTHTDTPLRRSEIGIFRTPVRPPIVNDDEEERRQARRRTIINDSVASSTIEENEALKNCLKIYSENKLSKDNAWSVSLIDTLSSLLEKHHKSLNNFKVAGSSLEASSKVYGLRVDSIHTDVVRMSAGLGKQRVVEEDCDNNTKENESSAPEIVDGHPNNEEKKKHKKRVRKQVSTITKNKETINGKLDTNPFTDPIFAKLNSIVGSINSSSRLLQNILPSQHSELRLRMEYSFWDFMHLNDDLSICDESIYSECDTIDCTKFGSSKLDDLLRPNQTGYNITDTPVEQDDDSREENEKDINESLEKDKNNSQMALAFDIDADVEPILSDTPTYVDVDMGDFNELTVDEQVAINNCKGLRRAPVMIEDMTPTDSTSSQLEYSYRPLDKISQFWAGPSHWKFKKNRNKSMGLANRLTQISQDLHGKTLYQKQKRKPLKIRQQQVQFGEPHDDLFQKLDAKWKSRKNNVQKKWDVKKLKLPTDLQIDHDVFDVYRYATGLKFLDEVEDGNSPDMPMECGYDYNNPVDQEYCPNIQNEDDYGDSDVPNEANNELMDQTVVEIATEFAGAPDKVTKIVVPFAKRAKVVDMKQLKKCCMQVIRQQFVVNEKENIPSFSEYKEDEYKQGYASFNKIYKTLPDLLTSNMVEALSTSIAFYSILHLANDSNLRLFQQDDLNDFQIRQLDI